MQNTISSISCRGCSHNNTCPNTKDIAQLGKWFKGSESPGSSESTWSFLCPKSRRRSGISFASIFYWSFYSRLLARNAKAIDQRSFAMRAEGRLIQGSWDLLQCMSLDSSSLQWQRLSFSARWRGHRSQWTPAFTDGTLSKPAISSIDLGWAFELSYSFYLDFQYHFQNFQTETIQNLLNHHYQWTEPGYFWLNSKFTCL